MHIGLVAEKTESIYGLHLVDIISHLLSKPDIIISVHESLKSSIGLTDHSRLNFTRDFSSLACDKYLLYGIGSQGFIKDSPVDICYIPDPDLKVINQQFQEELEQLVSKFREAFPLGSFLSLFAEELSNSFHFLKSGQETDKISPFDLCVVIDDDFGNVLNQFDLCNLNVLLIYIGSDNKSIEDYVEKLWESNPNISLSTFQEPVSFLHANLARKAIYTCKKFENLTNFLRVIRFNANINDLADLTNNNFS